MKNQLLKTTVIACAMGIMLFSCKKDDTTTIPSTTTSTSSTTPSVDTDLIIDDLSIEALFESSQTISDEGTSSGTNLKKGKTFGCATRNFTIDSVAKTATFTYTFDSTTLCTDGRVRSGSFSVTINSLKIRDKGTKATFTYSNFKVKDVTGATFEATGIRTVENLSDIDSVNGLHQRIIVTGLGGIGTKAVVKKKDGTTVQWYSDRVRKQTAGANTPKIFTDDVIEVTGTHGGISAKGNSYDVTIKTALVAQKCGDKAEPVSGKMDIVTNTVNYGIDFGNGACDGKIVVSTTVTVKGITTPVSVEVPLQ